MKLIFAGTPAFAADYLEALIQAGHDVQAVITQPDRPGKRGKSLQASPVKTMALQHQLSVIQPEKLKREHLEGLQPDLMIVVAYGQILRQIVLDFPTRGCINVHASLLPRWRGAAPVQRAILAGDTETGVTLMQMDAGLDTGDMLAKARVPITEEDTAGSLLNKLSAIGKPLLIDLLARLAKGDIDREPQDNAQSTYASKLEKDEAHVDWHASAAVVDRQVRAFQPDPVAWCNLADMRVKVHAGQVGDRSGASPGEILHVDKKGVEVACGDGSYLIQRIQLPVGKGAIMSGADVMNGRTDIVHPGVRLT